MKHFFLLYLILSSSLLFAQEESKNPKFYLGVAYGTSFPLGDFKDTDIRNSDAGFAKNGNRFDVYGGYFLDKKESVTATFVFRYQTFDTEIEDLIETFRNNNPNVNITGSTKEWQIYSLLFGAAYKLDLSPKFALFPRVAIGPIWAKSPGITINATNAPTFNNFERTSNTGVGFFGYEAGIGLRHNLGKHFMLLPTFTFSGGTVKIKDVVITTDNVQTTSDYSPNIISFNIGLSIAYRFY
jgi:hypothetical protein